ncbi:MAG: 50S ribosomal protein L15 [Deltaproteobacteria bacterium RIFOXYD12_FULL_57_12]|nr:MAG: 50S ribosomal protein L15 [Deltaproteobacteria bacterium RIFOXYD12_FULL_57_12]
MSLSNLSPNPASRKEKKRVGRGQGSGRGGTATRGHKGSKARSGYGVKLGFEGGQMPLQRRLPKRGFNNIFKKEYTIIDLHELDRFEAGTRIDRAILFQAGLVGKSDLLVKVLANGEITKSLTVVVDKVSAAARQKIEAAGGTVEG